MKKKKWEYASESFEPDHWNDDSGIVRFLNSYGDDGWELVHTEAHRFGTRYLFKRASYTGERRPRTGLKSTRAKGG